MTTKSKHQKRRAGRPPKPLPESIKASPEEIAKVFIGNPPPKNWPYLEQEGK